MKHPFTPRCRSLMISLLAASTTLASAAFAADLPKRKPGLWEIDTQIEGMPSIGPIQQCIDRDTDNLMEQKAHQQKQKCQEMDIKTSGRQVTIHSVCKIKNSTVTSDGVFEGAFDSSYTGTMRMRYNPPLNGIGESRMTQQAHWTGPCKAGQKPGDVIAPNIGGFNINEMMKNPKIRDMMKR